ncbi:MAG TPA: carboxypeptidase-like regulatory domain-containing protein, partial [Flavobacteriales bacterium]|nr:carboxypeptidase-like regulatory domain-containing protein [Flavobacteriales bacterium]
MNMKVQCISLAVFFLFFEGVGNAFAQKAQITQTIRGTIIDAQSLSPLPGANIVLLGTSPPVGSSSNEFGEFRIEDVPIGRRGVQVTFLGYNPLSIPNILVTSAKEVVLTISLEEKVFMREEIVIEAKIDKSKPLNQMATVSARTFSVEETSRYAGSFRDPARLATNFAGVSGSSDQRNDIIIRGNSPIGVLWRFDGLDIPNPNHFTVQGTNGGPISILNNNLLTNSGFYTGAFPAEYGNAIAGVFDLKMRNGNNEKHEFIGQFGMNG